MKNLSYVYILAMLFLAPASFAIKAPMKFGDVSMDDLKMTVYAADTSAPAVVLCEYGYFDPTSFKFTHLIRIKILKKTGYGWANKVFPPFNEAYVKGITSNLENGKIVETKLDSKNIFEETIYARVKRIRIAMPNVKIRSVIDIQFDYSGVPDSWEFQKEIPVRYSELVMENNVYISRRKNLSGFEPLKLNEDGHWIAENMPAFKSEPYISCVQNYLTKLELDIYEVHYSMYFKELTTTWDALCRYLDEDDYFGAALRNDSYMNRSAKEINSKAVTDKEKLRMAHDYIKTFKWNKNKSLYTSESNIKWSLDKKSGNSADINLALVQLLKKIGFEASPVILSTRDNGFLSPAKPTLTKLNYVIARVTLNDEQILMDGTEENAPYNLLPERDLNFFGRVFNTKFSDPVELTTNKKSKELITYNMTLDDDLQLRGALSFQRIDYAALDFRNKYKSFSGKESYLENMLEEFPGLRIRNATINNIDSVYMPVRDQYDITLKNAVEETNGNFYLYPMMLHRLKNNPFKIDKRKYPIDFVHKIENIYSVTISIPENFEVVSYPIAVNIGLPEKAAYFLYQVSVLGNSIQFNFKMGINKTVFTEEEYGDIREFYNQILAKHAEPVILKRK